jgi:two-component system, cell cycle response regulator CtrA
MSVLAAGSDRRSGSLIRAGKLVVDVNARIVELNDQVIRLTGKEYRILELLSLRKGTTVTKEMLIKHLYSDAREPEVKIIDIFVCHLRKKLAQANRGQHYIETIWGRGYALREPQSIAAANAA